MFWDKIKFNKNKDKKKNNDEKVNINAFSKLGKDKSPELNLNIDEVSADKFQKLYMKDTPYIQIAKCGDKPIGISVENDLLARSNDVLVVSTSHDNNVNQVIIPIIEKGNTSYIVYDPYGDIYGQVEGALKRNKYDIRVVDFSKNSNDSDRVDIFEAANLLDDPAEIVRIIARSFDNKKDVDIAIPLLEAACRYIMDKGVPLNAKRVAWVLRQLKHNNKRIVGDMALSPTAGAALKKKTSGVTKEVFFGVINELENRVAPAIQKFGTDPSIYGILTTKKNVAIFIKNIEPQYRFISTAMVYNLMVMSAALEDTSLNTVIIDEKNDSWYDKEEIKRWSDMTKGRKDCMIRISIRDRIPADMMNYFDPCAILFCGSVDPLTIDFIDQTIKKQYEVLEDKDLATQIMDRRELETIDKCIMLCNVNRKDLIVRPFKCELI